MDKLSMLIHYLSLLSFVACIFAKVEWKVEGKISAYGEDLRLFCTTDDYSINGGKIKRWEGGPKQKMLTLNGAPDQEDVMKYKMSILENGFDLVINNVSKADLNVTYECTYGFNTSGKVMLKTEDAFEERQATRQSEGKNNTIIYVIIPVTLVVLAVVAICISLLIHRKRKLRVQRNKNNTDCNGNSASREVPLLETDCLLPNSSSSNGGLLIGISKELYNQVVQQEEEIDFYCKECGLPAEESSIPQLPDFEGISKELYNQVVQQEEEIDFYCKECGLPAEESSIPQLPDFEDNCNVIIGKNSVLTRVQEKSRNDFNVGCVCHLAIICAQKAVKTLPLPVDDLLIDVIFHFHDFYHSSKHKEEYNSFLDFTDTESMKLLKHCGTRWLSLERCVRRLLQQWPALKSYFQSHAESEKPGRIMRCAEFLVNDEMWLYYAFLDFILPVLNDFNVMFQAGESMVGFLHTEMVRLLRKLMARFVSTKVITSQQDITKVDFQSTENQHDNERISIGGTAREFLSDHEELSPVVVNRFYSSVRQFYCTTVSTMIAKFPFKDKVLKTIAYLNPDTRQNVSPEDVASLSDRFLSLSPDQKSRLEDQASDYILSPKSDLPPYDKENTTMNQFWQSMAQRKIPSGQPQFDLLFLLSKVMHSNIVQCRHRQNLQHAEEDTYRQQTQPRVQDNTSRSTTIQTVTCTSQ